MLQKLHTIALISLGFTALSHLYSMEQQSHNKKLTHTQIAQEESTWPNRTDQLFLLTQDAHLQSLSFASCKQFVDYILDARNYDQEKFLTFNTFQASNDTHKEIALRILYTLDYLAVHLRRSRNKMVRSLYYFEDKYGANHPEYIQLKNACCRNRVDVIKFTHELEDDDNFTVIIQKDNTLNSLENISAQIFDSMPANCSTNMITSIIFRQLNTVHYLNPRWIQELYATFSTLKNLTFDTVACYRIERKTFKNAHPESIIMLKNLSRLKTIETKAFYPRWNNGIVVIKNCQNLSMASYDNIQCVPGSSCARFFAIGSPGYQLIYEEGNI